MSLKNFNFLLLMILAIGCSSESSQAVGDSGDSLSRTNELSDKKVRGALSDNQELDDIVNEYIRMYDKELYIDSTYIVAKDTIRVTVKHFCLKDNSITVPVKYVEIYKLDSFVTHSFCSMITVRKNSETIAELKIEKKDFEDYLDPNLLKYGVLLYPEIENMSTIIKIDYSLSIPLTDIGKSVSVVIDNEGKVKFESAK